MLYQEHLLITLMEECAEISYHASKALRFGIDDAQPVETGGDGTTNYERLTREIDDLLGVCELLGLTYGNPQRIQAKIDKVRHYADYAHQKGTLTTPEYKSLK